MAQTSPSRQRYLRPLRGARACTGFVALTAAWSCSGCGAAAPSLAPAHPLAAGRAELALGSAAAFPVNLPKNSALRAPARAITAAGVVPWISPRVGLPADNEVWGLFSGGSAGIGARHAWHLDENFALSVGLEGAWLNLEAPKGESPAVAKGWQAGIPVAFGWRSDTDLVAGWVGARGRYLATDARLGTDRGTLDDVAIGGLLGLSVGVHPIWARVELSADWHSVDFERTTPAPASHTFGLLTLTPAAALGLRF
jgi:hypothetical protein